MLNSKSGARWESVKHRMAYVFAISVLGLYLELLLIRWVTTEFRTFAYLQNTVLVVCFLGLGFGCFTCKKPVRFARYLVDLGILVALLSVPYTRYAFGMVTSFLSVFGDVTQWTAAANHAGSSSWAVLFAAIGLATTFILMILLFHVFVPIGRILGGLLADHPRPIRAYSVNVAGSLIGTWLFVALSVLEQPPLTWCIVLLLLSLPFFSRSRRSMAMEGGLFVAILAFSILAGRQEGALLVRWSPYQKLVLTDGSENEAGFSRITVNNAGYQILLNLAPDFIKTHPDLFPPGLAGYTQYDIPPRLHDHPDSMLIVGAGSGNDASGALRQGVGHVTAVEIDPVIVEMGRQYHPEKPYDDRRVQVVTDDARSFFARTSERYDLIAFGLLDSHTTMAMTNARLDHYVYTRESIEHAAGLLKEGGVMVLTFEAHKFYIIDRIEQVLEGVFGEAPIMFRIPPSAYGWGGIMFVAGDLEKARARIDADPKLKSVIDGYQAAWTPKIDGSSPITTDDWPYLYLPKRKIPTLYFFLALLMVGLFKLAGRSVGAPALDFGRGGNSWHFFFLGAAFLLLEVQNINKACVALGNTWWVSAVIISAVLVMILAANTIAETFRNIPLTPVYICLLGSCAGLYLIDLAAFAFLPFAVKMLLIGGLTTLPMVFSGIIFARSFETAAHKDHALGANLFGALVGGLLQSLSFLTGVKALLLVVALFYGLAWGVRPRREEGHPQSSMEAGSAG